MVRIVLKSALVRMRHNVMCSLGTATALVAGREQLVVKVCWMHV